MVFQTDKVWVIQKFDIISENKLPLNVNYETSKKLFP